MRVRIAGKIAMLKPEQTISCLIDEDSGDREQVEKDDWVAWERDRRHKRVEKRVDVENKKVAYRESDPKIVSPHFF